MKRIFTLALAFIASACIQLLYGQNKVTFGYDNAGNRISRTISLLKSAPTSESEDEPPVIYSEMLSDIEIKIYPNPTHGLLKVEICNLPEKQTAEVSLYDLSGRLITHRKTVDVSTEIDLSGQSDGIYVMKITAGEYQTEWRIIKK